MRKVNKILMATVSILLCLVLITTSVLSGIFAKYVITKKGSAAATLKKFGVTLDMAVDDEALEDAGADVETAEDFYKVTKSVTITGLKMAPGESIEDAVKINISGTAGVRLKVVIEPKVVFDEAAFEAIVPNDRIEDFLGVPIGLYYTAYDANSKTVIKPFVQTWASADCKFQASQGCDLYFCKDYNFNPCSINHSYDDTHGWVEKIFDAGQNIVFSSLKDNKTVNQFNFHLKWEDRGTGDPEDLFNRLDMAATNANPQLTVQIILNVTVEQVDGDYESPVPLDD